VEPRIVARPAFTVVGIGSHSRHEQGDIPALWDRFNARRGEVRALGPGAYGVEGPVDPDTGAWGYLAGVEVDPTVPVPEGMARWEVPAQAYAVFTCTLATLRQEYDRLEHVWLPRSGYRRAVGPEFEYYGAEFHPGHDDSPVSVYIPIAPQCG